MKPASRDLVVFYWHACWLVPCLVAAWKLSR